MAQNLQDLNKHLVSKVVTLEQVKQVLKTLIEIVEPTTGGQQAGEPDVAAMTTVGANTGTAGAGLSLIGDTSTTNQASNIMNDLLALQEDVTALRTTVNSLITKLEGAGILATV